MYAASDEEASTQKNRNPRAGSKLSRLQQQRPKKIILNDDSFFLRDDFNLAAANCSDPRCA
jgi:hypothetical protein